MTVRTMRVCIDISCRRIDFERLIGWGTSPDVTIEGEPGVDKQESKVGGAISKFWCSSSEIRELISGWG